MISQYYLFLHIGQHLLSFQFVAGDRPICDLTFANRDPRFTFNFAQQERLED